MLACINNGQYSCKNLTNNDNFVYLIVAVK